ncbi:hypothetical protein EMCRGX_G007440 [Ephydatia muelleri]
MPLQHSQQLVTIPTSPRRTAFTTRIVAAISAEPFFSTSSTATIAIYISSTGAAFSRVPPTSSYPFHALRGFITLYITPGFSFLHLTPGSPLRTILLPTPGLFFRTSLLLHLTPGLFFRSFLLNPSFFFRTFNHQEAMHCGGLPCTYRSIHAAQLHDPPRKSCSQLVANSRHASHLHQCSRGALLQSPYSSLFPSPIQMLVKIFLHLNQPLEFACKAGAEKIVHSMRRCIEDIWLNGDFVVFKVDMLNAFNMVSRQAVLDECAKFFPELLPWVSWCNGSHNSLWHPMGRLTFMGPFQFSACVVVTELVHLARATPPSRSADYLKLFDEEVRLCFTSCIAVDVPDPSWQQAQLSPSLGGLGFRSLGLHSSAAFIASFASSGFCPDNIHMLQAVTRFNAQVHPQESTTAEAVLACPSLQRALSKKLDNHAFQSLLSSS